MAYNCVSQAPEWATPAAEKDLSLLQLFVGLARGHGLLDLAEWESNTSSLANQVGCNGTPYLDCYIMQY